MSAAATSEIEESYRKSRIGDPFLTNPKQDESILTYLCTYLGCQVPEAGMYLIPSLPRLARLPLRLVLQHHPDLSGHPTAVKGKNLSTSII